jgi:cell division protein FtsW (lipid II flippase)
MRKVLVTLLVIAAVSVLSTAIAGAQDKELEDRVSRLESTARDDASVAAVFFLFGAFCALWAQNTGRRAWAWFFLGLLFNVITVIVLLSKNARERASPS